MTRTVEPLSCHRCGKPNSVRRGRKFCSRECAGTARTRPASLACAQCGELFTPERVDLEFCSRECSARSRRDRVGLECAECGTRFEVPKSVVSKGRGKFCSRACMDAVGWQHGTLYGYDQMGCRCDECSARKADRGKARRAAAKRDPRPAHIPHGTRGSYGLWGCRCDLCREARREAGRLEYAQNQERENERSKRYKSAFNHQTQENAVNSGKAWTGAELEIVVTRTDLTLEELGALLGRSYAAVQCARTRATHDPKWRQVAGVGSA